MSREDMSKCNNCKHQDDWMPCDTCVHNSDPQNKGTRLYECSGCDFEGSHENGQKYGILNWLQQPEEK